MPLVPDSPFQYPNYPNLREKEYSKTDNIEVVSDDEHLDIFGAEFNDMTGSPSPFIKDEPTDLQFNSPFNNFNMDPSNHFNAHHFGSHNSSDVDPQALGMNHGFASGSMNSHNNMSGSFGMGIGDDELENLNFNDGNAHNFPDFNQQHAFRQGSNAGAVNINTGMISSTPQSDAPFSPYTEPRFFQPAQHGHHQQHMQHGVSMPNPSFARPSHMARQASDSRSPLTPKQLNLRGMTIGTPENSYPGMHRQKHSIGGNVWDGTPGSAGSTFLESPMSSPHQHGSFQHPAMADVMGKHPASLPVKTSDSHGGAAMQTQEAKRKKRRESHNAVERRRRDNINERIHDLSRLVPQHRLEDEKIRKHIHNNGALSPTLTATGVSPPHATSLLAGGTGRRAAGNITQGLPIEDKDKGPNKGDILNGAVSWTRDLMWMLHEKIRQVEELKNTVTDLGGNVPFQTSEAEVRMQSELLAAISKNGPDSFQYSRSDGSGLRVPGHTHINGDKLSSPQSNSPGMQSAGSNAGGWSNEDRHGSFSLKEEDEFMDFN